MKAAKQILSNETTSKMQNILLSIKTVKSQIINISQDIEEQFSLIKKSIYFTLQCDKDTNVVHCCQLLILVRFLSGDNIIIKELLLSHVLEIT